MLNLPADPSETPSKPSHPYNKKGLFIIPNNSSPRSALSNGHTLEIDSPQITDKLNPYRLDTRATTSSSQQLSTTGQSQKTIPEKIEGEISSNNGQVQLPGRRKSLYKQLSAEEARRKSADKSVTASNKPSCPICSEDFDKTSIVQPLDCKHKFCEECVSMYIKRQIEEFNVLKIKCPQDQCTGLYGNTHIQAILDKDAYEKYQQKKLIKLRNRDFQLKYCPKPGCARPFYPDHKSKTTKCNCGMAICNDCFNPHHKGKPCLEAAEGEYELYLENKDLKKCFMCKTIIEKQIGCSHMTCPVCDYEWCWNCGREWDTGHVENCLNEWNPRPPKVLQNQQHLNVVDQFINAIFLVLEIIVFGLVSALGVALIWPCLMTEEFSIVFRKKMKNRSVRVVLAGLLALVTWPFVVVVYPVSAILQEYGTCLKKKRWLKGTSAKFGFHNKFMKRENPLQLAFRKVQRRLSRGRNNNDNRVMELQGNNVLGGDNNRIGVTGEQNRVEVVVVV